MAIGIRLEPELEQRLEQVEQESSAKDVAIMELASKLDEQMGGAVWGAVE